MTTIAQPADRDAERRLVAAVAIEPTLFRQAAYLAAGDFLLLETRAAWERMSADAAAGRPIVSADYGAFLSADFVTPLPEFVAEDARRVAQAAMLRRALAGASQLAAAIAANDVDRVRSEIAQLQRVPVSGGEETLRAVSDYASEMWDLLDGAGALAEMVLPTGLRGLDAPLDGGLELTTATVLMARPSMGKTAALVQIADHVSAAGKVVAVFSKETAGVKWGIRHICRRARVSWSAYKAGNVTDDQRRALTAALDDYRARGEAGRLWVDETTTQTTDAVYVQCDRLAQRVGRLDLVIADHLRLFVDKGDNENHRLGHISRGFNRIARDLKTRCLFAAQLSRSVEGQIDKRPDLKDLRDSGEIEENADNVVGLYRDSYYSEDAHDKTAEFLVRKARDGERNGRGKMVFLGDVMSFEPLQVTGEKANGKTQGAHAPQPKPVPAF